MLTSAVLCCAVAVSPHTTHHRPNGVILGAALTVPKPVIQVPVVLQCMLGCRLDKLSVVQQMILKTAAIIGEDFSYDFVAHTYPLALENKDSKENKERKESKERSGCVRERATFAANAWNRARISV